MTSGPLEGIVVADFTRVLAGPYCTMLLGDMGAEVIKVERPGAGDDTRAWGPPYTASGLSTYFAGVNRNKSTVGIDLSTPEGVRAARDLIARADIVIENFKAGTLERLGLDYATVSTEHPGLVFCTISGFGSGAGRDLPGYDLLVQAMGGLMSVTGPGPGEPTKVGVALVDVITGLHATVGILAALHHRDATGEGQRLEVNLLSSLLSGLVNQSSAYAGAGVVPGILGNAHPSIAPYEVYATADRPLIIAVGNDRQFASLAEVLGAPGLAEDPRFRTNPDRVTHRVALNEQLVALLAGAGADEWQHRLTQSGVPCGPINDIAQAFALAERLGLEPVVDADGTPTVAHPIRFDRTPATYRLPPPSAP
ncbi:MAG: carnitine dehydratase [Actinomycetales bacterium mxb001]|nr:MAG: carnitine dehydratase [Actinomycetales bacterium mxb001]